MDHKNIKTPFWSSWTGTIVLGLGILCLLVSCVYLHETTERMPEWREVRQLLSEGKRFEQYFAFIAKIEPLENNKYARHWAIEHTSGRLKGYFTITVTGWSKLDDKRESNKSFIVHFRQIDDGPIVLTKIEEQLGAKVVFENLKP